MLLKKGKQGVNNMLKVMNNDVREAFKTLYKELYRLHRMTAKFEIEQIDLGDVSCLELLHMTALTFGMTDEQFNEIADEVESSI